MLLFFFPLFATVIFLPLSFCLQLRVLFVNSTCFIIWISNFWTHLPILMFLHSFTLLHHSAFTLLSFSSHLYALAFINLFSSCYLHLYFSIFLFSLPYFHLAISPYFLLPPPSPFICLAWPSLPAPPSTLLLLLSARSSPDVGQLRQLPSVDPESSLSRRGSGTGPEEQ